MRPASSHMLRRSTADCTVFLGWDSAPALSAAYNYHDVPYHGCSELKAVANCLPTSLDAGIIRRWGSLSGVVLTSCLTVFHSIHP